MKSPFNWIPRAALVLALAVPLQAGTTWIVDVNGGPGVNFTDIPPAITAAAPGDIILVHGGMYSAFTMTKGVTLLGTYGATQISCCTPATQSIVSVPAGETAVIADLWFYAGDFWILNSAGTVIADRLYVPTYTSTAKLVISSSSDARIHRYQGGRASIGSSHFEIASSTIAAGSGTFTGQPGLVISGASNGVLSRSSCTGGSGQSVPIGGLGDGGNGGLGISFTSGPNPLSTLLIAGGGVGVVHGGNGGSSYIGSWGEDADGLHNERGGVWRSGCTFIPGNGTFGAAPVSYVAGPGSFDTPVSPDDPTLEMLGTPVKGATVQLNVYATPGSVVRLTLGNTPIIVPTAGVRVEKLVSADETLFLGVVPASGVISETIYFRRAFTTGMTFYAQAFMFDNVAGETRRTNSVPLIMR